MPNPIKLKFIEHMELYGLSKETQKGYISGVRCLANHYKMSPEHLTYGVIFFAYLANPFL